ncbi:hypothetical protein GCM10011611_19990 [Aliidongia dinghuensis]|uniref:Uncharacterized protein n=1 Tax=Aliidongia dinghuensis TaxID=1867774 RepID=A0A8J2YT41_9PROT|nr:hypothetical protein [Aliidongia dinghuensis]GGF14234.1 hypothetical protein GCM10011611_19990 [Aliidongia dinghuensis]
MTDRATEQAPSDALPIVDGLKQPLERISEEKFGAAATLLEEIRHVPGVQQVLDHVRPRLVKVRPQRKPNLQRLFYRPLEDLMTDGAVSPGSGLLPRRLPATLWRYLLEAGDVEPRKRLEAALRRTKIGDEVGQMAIARRLWPWAADALAALAAEPVAVMRALGSEAGFIEELKLIQTLCRVAEAVETLRAALPARPIPSLSDAQMGLVRRIVTESAGTDPDKVYALVLTVMVRMARPMEFLHSFMGLTLGLAAADRSRVFDRLAPLVVGEVSDRARQLETVRREDLVGMADHARALIHGLDAAERVLRNDPDTRRHLHEARKTAEAAVARLVDDAAAQLRTAVALGAEAPVAALVDCENSILALRKCQTFAGRVGLDRLVDGTLGKLVADVRRRIEALFDKVGGRTGTLLDRGAAMLELYWAVRMTELASSPDAADRLRREGLSLID